MSPDFKVGQIFRRDIYPGSAEFYELTEIRGKNHILQRVRKEYTEYQDGVKVRVCITPAESGEFLDKRHHRCIPYFAPPHHRVRGGYVLGECIRDPKAISNWGRLETCFEHYYPETPNQNAL